MKKRIIVGIVLALLLAGTVTVSAQQTIFASYNKPGNVNVYVEAGYGYLLGVGAGLEYVIGKFDIGPMPFQWGVMGMAAADLLPGFELAAGGMATLHLGLIWNIDLFVGLGIGFEFLAGYGLGFAETSGLAYKLSDNFTVLLTDTWISSVSIYGVGIQLKL